jgi:hypothetical protein
MRAQSLNRGTFSGPYKAYMSESGVGVQAHLPAERIDLTRQVALGRPANGAIAGHMADALEVECRDSDPAAHARRGKRGLAPRMAGANYKNVEL